VTDPRVHAALYALVMHMRQEDLSGLRQLVLHMHSKGWTPPDGEEDTDDTRNKAVSLALLEALDTAAETLHMRAGRLAEMVT
jgi:hypothetical protein